MDLKERFTEMREMDLQVQSKYHKCTNFINALYSVPWDVSMDLIGGVLYDYRTGIRFRSLFTDHQIFLSITSAVPIRMMNWCQEICFKISSEIRLLI